MTISISNHGRAADPVPLTKDDVIISLPDCPDCQGRGWFLINPFATGGSNGAGGVGNLCQCQTCKDAEAYWREHGALPPDLVRRIEGARS